MELISQVHNAHTHVINTARLSSHSAQLRLFFFVPLFAYRTLGLTPAWVDDMYHEIGVQMRKKHPPVDLDDFNATFKRHLAAA
jgi:hypothetical protein